MNGKTILLVEDDAIIAMSEAVILEKYGARVITVYSGEQALETFAATPEIDLVLMDIDLGKGKMEGTQAAELILQQRELPVIFLSCHNERGVVEKTEGITSYGYIVKRSGETALVTSVKMAFRLFETRLQARAREQSLQESEERFRQAMTALGSSLPASDEMFAKAFYHAPALMALSTFPDGRYISVNDEFIRVFGFSREEVLGRTAVELGLLLEQDRRRTLEMLHAQGRAVDLEATLYARDGRPVECLLTSEVLCIGAQQYQMSLGQDISARKQAQDALRKSEKKYRTVVDGLTEGVVLQDRSGAIITGNRAAAAILGLAGEQILGLNSVDSRWQAIHEDGSPFPGEAHPAMVTLQTGQPQQDVVMGVHKPDGTLVWLSISSQMISIGDDSQQPDTVLVSFTDITRRKQIEEDLRLKTDEIEKFFSSALDLLCIADTDGNFIRVNKEWSNVLGYSLEELEGRRFLDFVHPDDIESTLAAVSDLTRQRMILNFNNRYRCRDGSYRWIEWRSVPAENKRIYAAARDITERMQMEKAMEKAYHEKRDLLRELQHRAKNSFLMITSMLTLMRDTSQSEEARNALEEVGARVMALTNLYDLLYATDAVTEVQLDAYCARLLASFPFQSNLRISHAFEPVTIQVRIAAPLGLILTELLTNAVKHAFPDGRPGLITVSLRQAAATAILQVEDDGVGLPPGFDPMLNKGLGLTLVQALTGQVQGRFQIESGNGTRCRVEFPG